MTDQPATTTRDENGNVVWIDNRFDNRHPPFQDENENHLVHGSYSPRRIAERSREIHDELLVVAPWLAKDFFIPAVSRYLSAASREALLDASIRKTAVEKGLDKVPSRTWEQCTAAARLAAKLGSELGLDPLGHARLRAVAAGAEVAQAAVADIAARGAEIEARRQAEMPS